MADRSAFRIVSRAVAWIVLALLLVLAIGLYWLGTQHALQWLAREAVAVAQGRLELEGVQGSLYDRVSVSRAAYRDAGVEITASDVALAWRPERLLRRELHITELSVGEARVATAGSGAGEPPQLPAALKLPLSVTIAQASARRIEIVPGTVVQDLRFGLRARADAHTLELASVEAMGWRASGTLRVDAAAPFGARGQFAVSGKALNQPVAARIIVGGKLEILQVQASTSARGAAVTAAAALRPFSAAPLEKLTLDAESVDLAQWDKTLPVTKIGLSAEARMSADGNLDGTLRAENAAYGPLDARRLPVSRASLAFAGAGTNWTLSNIDVGIGSDGRVLGSGSLKDAAARLELKLADVAGAALHARLKPLLLSGSARVTADPDAQRVAATLEAAGARLELAARHAGQVVTVERGALTAEDAQLDFTGRAALAGSREFSVDAQFRGFDPARFVEAPPARLNGSVSAQGVLSPDWRVRARVDIAESRFRGQPLNARADFETGMKQLFAGEARALYAGNRLEVSGRFGAPGDALKWSLDAPNLKAIDAALAGNATGRGTLAGSLTRPSVTFELNARGLAAGGIAAGTVDAQGTLDAAPDGAFRMRVRAAGIKAPGPGVDVLEIDTQGTRLRHDISVRARGADFDASLEAAGGLDDDWRWNGSLAALEARGRVPFKLTAPARLSVGPGLASVEALQAGVLGGRIGPASIRVENGRVTTSGSLAGITAKALLALAPQAGIDPRDLAIGGRWDITLGETLSGFAEIRRESGDLGVKAEKDLQLGLERLSLTVSAQGDAVEAALDAASKRVGAVAAQARTRIERRDGAWTLTGNAPLGGSVTVDVKSLAWLRAFVPRFERIEGRAAARLELGGSVAQPLITGTASADAVELRALDPGLALSEGALRATFDGRTLQVSRLGFKAGEGKIEVEGTADLSGGLKTLELTARADRARILATPQLTVVLSGEGRAGLRDLQLALEGKFKVDEGRYDLGSQRKPELSEDVVVAGRTARAAPDARPMRVFLDLTVALNDNFVIRGYGLDAILGGSVRITTRDDALHALGTIRTVRGDYFAYGQLLDLQRGALNFAGPLGNPGLDLRAGRKIKSVNVGVEVSGSLARPVVKLVSDPEMSDSEKLGWLLLGRDPQTASAAELAMLQAAALTSGSRGTTSTQKKIAEGLGLDEFGVSQGGEGDFGALALGKRITDRLTVRLEQGIGNTAASLVKIDFLLTERWRIEGTAGTENAADIFFTLRFD